MNNLENNGVLSFIKCVLFSVLSNGYTIKQSSGDIVLNTYEELEEGFKSGKITADELKSCKE